MWTALLNLVSDRGRGNDWPEGYLPISNRQLLAELGEMSERSMMRARNELVQLGLIAYVPGHKGTQPLYEVHFFAEDGRRDGRPDYRQDYRQDCRQIDCNSGGNIGGNYADPTITRVRGDGDRDGDCDNNLTVSCMSVTQNRYTDDDDDDAIDAGAGGCAGARESFEGTAQEDELSDEDAAWDKLQHERHEAAVTGYVSAIGRRPNKAEADYLASVACANEIPPELVIVAIQDAGRRGANNPALYAARIMDTMSAECIYTPVDWDHYRADQRLLERGIVDWEHLRHARERRRQRHEEAKRE